MIERKDKKKDEVEAKITVKEPEETEWEPELEGKKKISESERKMEGKEGSAGCATECCGDRTIRAGRFDN